MLSDDADDAHDGLELKAHESCRTAGSRQTVMIM